MSKEPKFSWKIASAFAAVGAVSVYLTYQSYTNLPDHSAANNSPTPDLKAEVPTSRAQTPAQSFESAAAPSTGRAPKPVEKMTTDERIGFFYYQRAKNTGSTEQRFLALRWALINMGNEITKKGLQNAGDILGEDPQKLGKELREAAQAFFRDKQAIPGARASQYEQYKYWNALRMAHSFTGLDDNGVQDDAAAKASTGFTKDELNVRRNQYVDAATIEIIPKMRADLKRLGIPSESPEPTVEGYAKWEKLFSGLSLEQVEELNNQIFMIYHTTRMRNDEDRIGNMKYFGLSYKEFNKLRGLSTITQNVANDYAEAHAAVPQHVAPFSEFAREVLNAINAPGR